MDNIKGLMVVTPYNKKTYRVGGIELGCSPMSTFQKRDGSNISFKDYFKIRYDANIIDLTQPLVSVTLANKMAPRGSTENVLLIPEMCIMTGLTEEMRGNMGIMKVLSKHLHMEPKERVEALHSFIAKLSGTARVSHSFSYYNFMFYGN